MAMKSSNRWLGLLLLAVSSASAYHEGTYSYGSSSSTGCIEDYISDGYCDNQNVRSARRKTTGKDAAYYSKLLFQALG